MSVTVKPKNSQEIPWSDEYFITIHELTKQGLSQKDIMGALGISESVWKRWVREHPAITSICAKAKCAINGTATYQKFVYESLSPELQILWDQINGVVNIPNGRGRVEAILKNQGVLVKQHLFLYALIHHNFNASKALRSLCLSKKEDLDVWVEKDPDFATLMDEICWHQGNYYEGALFSLVQRGDPAAVIFVNKTYNRYRGYNDKVTVGHTGKVEHQHTISLQELESLPLETRVAILEAHQKQFEPEILQLEQNQVDIKEVG